MSSTMQPDNTLNSLDRYRFLMILNAANACQEYQFAKDATMLWLANYSGDLFVKHYQAIAFANLDLQNQAIAQFESIVALDPTFLETVRALHHLAPVETQRKYYGDLAHYLEDKSPPDAQTTHWLAPLWKYRVAFAQGDFDSAMTLLHEVIAHNPPSPLPAILHLKTAHELGNQEMLNNLSEIYHQQWPNCLQINIIRALVEIELGLEATAVERLHWVAANDNAGQVIEQLMGIDHQFKDLWPKRMDISFDLPIPASVSAYLGWNRLNTGTMKVPTFAKNIAPKPAPQVVSNDEVTRRVRVTSTPPAEKTFQQAIPENMPLRTAPEQWASDESLDEIQGAFSKIAQRLKKPELERADNRFPVYVVMSSKGQLEKAYGPNTAAVIDGLLSELVGLIQSLPGWGATLFYPDAPEELAAMGIKPVIGSDPWKIKLALADLDRALGQRGEMIGALLIVGGSEIIPFHTLPNPTFDDDLDVPSDNPYACIDENYFVAQWPVGRLPGEAGPDAGLLLEQIRSLTYQYQKRNKNSKALITNVTTFINWFIQVFNNLGNNLNQKKSHFGYSAEIWQRASVEVFKPVGDAKNLQLSPPLHANNVQLDAAAQVLKLGYFNLHGVKDGPNWYGQKDFTSASNGPDYPIALTPTMFDDKNPAPKLVFTEACYGANILEKQCDEALSLKLLDTGTQSFVGSTCVAYGSITPPLIAADYLANAFWQNVLEGMPAGYALMQAKLRLAEEMIKAQGFLDGEDQKTLLSFVLYGDPLAFHDGLQAMPKPQFRYKSYPKLKTISDYDMFSSSDESDLPKQVKKQVKKVVEKYLPGLENAQMNYKKSLDTAGGKSGSGTTNNHADAPDRYMVTLKKLVEENQPVAHQHYARMTFDKKGKLIKFTTSR